jgi:hypothetical protein
VIVAVGSAGAVAFKGAEGGGGRTDVAGEGIAGESSSSSCTGTISISSIGVKDSMTRSGSNGSGADETRNAHANKACTSSTLSIAAVRRPFIVAV